MFDVAALGELLIDFSYAGADADGYPTLSAHPGGAPANLLAALSAYGAKTTFLGKVGEDTFGQLLRSTLEKSGIDTQGLVSDPSVFTTLAFVTLDQSGDRSFSFARKPGADTCLRPDELNLELLNQSRVLHFGSLSLTDEPSRSATMAAIEYARQKGLLISFDPNLRKPLWSNLSDARRRIQIGLKLSDIVKISEEEIDFLFGCSPEEGADRLLRDYDVRLVMVTLGPDGCLLKNRTASCRMAAPPVQTVDTTGAGDIFGGSALGRVLAFEDAPEALTHRQLAAIARFATAAASLSTQQLGGISSVPSLRDVVDLCRDTCW